MIEAPRIDFSVSPWVLELLTHLWQSSVVALAILGLLALGRRLSARTRRTMGWIAVAKFAVPVAWVTPAFERVGAVDLLVWPVELAPVANAAAAPEAQWSGVTLAGLIWAGGAVLLFGRWTWRARQTRRRLLESATPASAALQARVARAAAVVGLRRIPRCVVVAAEHPPGVLGGSEPRLILPAGLVEALAPAEIDAILIHECVHVRGRDPWWSAVRAGFVALLWFNPVAWLLNRVLATETEKACDERVVELTGDAESYAGSIVAAVRHSLGIVGPGFSGATTPPVVSRLEAILAHRPHRERSAARWLALGASLALVVGGGLAGSVTKAQTETARPAAWKIGALTITFVGPAPMTEEAVRGLLPFRAGSEFNETTLDQAVRTIYRTGHFKFVEVKQQGDSRDGLQLNFVLTAEAAGGTPSESAPSPAPDPEKKTATPDERAEARAKLDAARLRLEKLRAEREQLRPVVRETAPAAANPGLPSGHWDGQPVYELAALDQKPVPRFQARPQYPFELRRSKISGEVVVDFIVDAQGEVVNARALRSSHPGFEAAAVQAVTRWKFRPGLKDGAPVNTHLQVPIVFSIEER